MEICFDELKEKFIEKRFVNRSSIDRLDWRSPFLWSTIHSFIDRNEHEINIKTRRISNHFHCWSKSIVFKMISSSFYSNNSWWNTFKSDRFDLFNTNWRLVRRIFSWHEKSSDWIESIDDFNIRRHFSFSNRTFSSISLELTLIFNRLFNVYFFSMQKINEIHWISKRIKTK